MCPLQGQPTRRPDCAGQTRQQDKGIRVPALTEHPGGVGPEEPLDLTDLVGLPGRPELVREQRGGAGHGGLGDHRVQRDRRGGQVEQQGLLQGVQHSDTRRGVEVGPRDTRRRLPGGWARTGADQP
jgi:hypothetical protein